MAKKQEKTTIFKNKKIIKFKNEEKCQKNDKKFTKMHKNTFFASLTIMDCIYFLKTVKNKNMLSDTSFCLFVHKIGETKSTFGHF